MKRTIEITVSGTGEISIEAIGYRGADCEAATKHLEEALGVVGERIKKPEYSQRATTKRQQKLRT